MNEKAQIFFVGLGAGLWVATLCEWGYRKLMARYEAKQKHALVVRADEELLSRFVQLAKVSHEAKKRGFEFTEKQ